MRKLWILTVLFVFIMAGCGATSGGFIENVSTDDTTTTAVETTTATEASTTLQPTTSTTTTSTSSRAKVAAVAPTTTEAVKMEDKTIPLNAETERGDGKLTFRSVRLYYNENINKNMAVFSYETSDEDAVMPVESGTHCVGVSGKKYVCKGMGGVNNTGEMHFYNVTDFSDLSTCTITYAFEGFDPVTVTIDIPM